MADIKRSAQAIWAGDLRNGSGKISGGGGVFHDLPYSVPSRFETGKGTNPEELIAAAHAGCFSMMLAKILGDQKVNPRDIQTRATITLGQRGGGWKLTAIHLETEVAADGLSADGLTTAANAAKEQCPVSTLLKPGLESLTMEARLRS